MMLGAFKNRRKRYVRLEYSIMINEKKETPINSCVQYDESF